MKIVSRRFLCLLLIAFLSINTLYTAGFSEDVDLEKQKIALDMLNYLTVLTKETNDSKNSRLFMEEAYSLLINNTNLNAVDQTALSRITRLLDTMEKYRMINVKRERLQYIYEQTQAQSIRATIPNPMGMLSAVHSFTPARLVASVVYMAVDAASSYQTSTAENELQYLKDGWELDDQEASELHQSRKDMFKYMATIVNKYKLDGSLALSEKAVDEFTKWKGDSNIAGRIYFLTSNENTYRAYGGYWLALAESYYQAGEPEKCISALKTYEDMDIGIFRQDYEYAKVLPLAIAAAAEILADEDYVNFTADRANAIYQNTDNDEWALRYYAAQAYIDVYEKTKNAQYLEDAYMITLNNVNNLIHQQKSLNEGYIAAVKEITPSDDSNKEEKTQIQNYNKMLKELRVKELPPISEALLLNCDLIVELVELMNLPAVERKYVDSILHPNGDRLFLVNTLDDRYWVAQTKYTDKSDLELAFNGTEIVIPVTLLTPATSISVSVDENDESELLTLDDWKLERVVRKIEGDINTYGAIFTSENARKHTWGADSTITITINSPYGLEPMIVKYTAENVKNEWYDYIIKAFEGHKNEWYDYLKVWENTVNFIRVE